MSSLTKAYPPKSGQKALLSGFVKAGKKIVFLVLCFSGVSD